MASPLPWPALLLDQLQKIRHSHDGNAIMTLKREQMIVPADDVIGMPSSGAFQYAIVGWIVLPPSQIFSRRTFVTSAMMWF
jgi:hypothetical protein